MDNIFITVVWSLLVFIEWQFYTTMVIIYLKSKVCEGVRLDYFQLVVIMQKRFNNENFWKKIKNKMYIKIRKFEFYLK